MKTHHALVTALSSALVLLTACSTTDVGATESTTTMAAAPAATTAPATATASGGYATTTASTGARGPATNNGFVAMTESDFELLKASVLFSDDDVAALRMSRAVLEPNVEELLDVWYGFVGANEHLLASFSHPTTGAPDARYLERVRARFRRWVLATADANFDQAWLDRQLEFGLRHHRLKKNQTDGVEAAAHIPFRYLVALHHPVTATLRPFLERGDHTDAEVEAMHEAWRKVVLMTTILWSQPYVAPADF